jgi:hypothetical protein
MLFPKTLVVPVPLAALLPPVDAPVASTAGAVTLLNWAISDSTSVICVSTNCAAVVFLLVSSEDNSFSYLASCLWSDPICDWLLDPIDVDAPTADTMVAPSDADDWKNLRLLCSYRLNRAELDGIHGRILRSCRAPSGRAGRAP